MRTGEKNLACFQNYADGEGMSLIFKRERAPAKKMEYKCIFSYTLFQSGSGNESSFFLFLYEKQCLTSKQNWSERCLHAVAVLKQNTLFSMKKSKDECAYRGNNKVTYWKGYLVSTAES